MIVADNVKCKILSAQQLPTVLAGCYRPKWETLEIFQEKMCQKQNICHVDNLYYTDSTIKKKSEKNYSAWVPSFLLHTVCTISACIGANDNPVPLVKESDMIFKFQVAAT